MAKLQTVLVSACVVLPAVVLAQGDNSIAVLPVSVSDAIRDQVPDIIDDYTLSAIQDAAGVSCIGPDDIQALIGFEQQKDLLGCDDIGCMANLGGALGVERIVAIKLARIDNDWVWTGKLINIQQARVEKRTTAFVTGGLKDLLRATPDLAARLFGKEPAAVADPPPAEPAPAVEPRADSRPTRQHHEQRGRRAARRMPLAAEGEAATLDQFLIAGLSQKQHNEYQVAGPPPYALWAAEKNKESMGLEALKWILTGAAILMAIPGLCEASLADSEDGDPDQCPVVLAVYAVSALATWIIDLSNPGSVPDYVSAGN